MALVTLIEAKPRPAAGGAQVDVRLAGGPTRAYIGHRGFTDWRAGVVTKPRFSRSIGFGEEGWTGASSPQSATFEIGTADPAFLSYLGGLFWTGAPVEIYSGDDELPLVWTRRLKGVVASASTEGPYVRITVADVSRDIDRPVAPDTFAGTGGLEGGDEATGRAKRRNFGHCWNVEGRVLDKAFNVYEFSDPARPLLGFYAVKDKGRAGPGALVDWQGSRDATLAALRAASAPYGGSVQAPSIACVKWWTTPAGPLTADIAGEIPLSGPGDYTSTPVGMAAYILAQMGGIAVTNFAEVGAFRPIDCGWHVGDNSMTAAQLVDRILLGASLLWTVDTNGDAVIREWSWTTPPVAALRSERIARETVFRPLGNRKLGFQANQHIHSDADISAALILADDVTYVDGTPIEVLKPAEAGANVTGTNTAAAIAGQGALATTNAADFGTQVYGPAKPANNADVTAANTAAAIAGQGALATLNIAGYFQIAIDQLRRQDFDSDSSTYTADDYGEAVQTTGLVNTLTGVQASGEIRVKFEGLVTITSTGGQSAGDSSCFVRVYRPDGSFFDRYLRDAYPYDEAALDGPLEFSIPTATAGTYLVTLFVAKGGTNIPAVPPAGGDPGTPAIRSWNISVGPASGQPNMRLFSVWRAI